MNKLRGVLSLLMIVLSFQYAASQTQENKEESGRRYDYLYLESVNSKLKGDYSAAFSLLNHCIAMCPERPESYYDRSVLYGMIGRNAEALEDIKKAYSIDKTEKLYQQSLFYNLLVSGDYKNAASIGEEISAKSSNIQILNILVSIYDMLKDYDSMLRTLNRIEEINGADEEIALAKMQIFERRGEKNRAYEELKALSDKNPRNTKYKVMLGNWLLQNEHADEAYKLYLEVLDKNPCDEAAGMSLFDYYRERGLDEKADSLAKSLVVSEGVQPDSKVVLMGYLINNIEKKTEDNNKVVELFDEVLSSRGECADILEMKAAYMILKKMPQDQVIEACKEVLAKYPDRLSIRLQLLQEYWGRQDFDSVIKYSEPSEEYTATDVSVYYFLGLAYVYREDMDKALASMIEGTKYINEESNSTLVSDVYCIIGDLSHERGLVQQSFDAYDKCLEYNQDNVECLNNYAYFLSLEDLNLDKAEQMSLKAIMAEPDNNTYLDTYAWILFLQGKYGDAKTYAEKLIGNESSEEAPSPVVLEHVGDIYSMNGDAEKAVEYWKKARVDGEKNKMLEKKIRKRAYIPEKKKR